MPLQFILKGPIDNGAAWGRTTDKALVEQKMA